MPDQPNPPARLPDPDAPWVQRSQGGDYQAFEHLVSRYEGPIYALARRIVQSPQDAEEVVQDTFLSVLEHIQGFAGHSTFHTWLVAIATNHALRILRKRKRTPRPQGQAAGDAGEALPRPEFIAPWQDDPRHLAERRETRQLLAEALDALDEKYRLVFVLRDVQGLSTQEAAQALSITPTNAKVRLLRARLMLRERLTRHFGDQAARVAPHQHEDEKD